MVSHAGAGRDIMPSANASDRQEFAHIGTRCMSIGLSVIALIAVLAALLLM